MNQESRLCQNCKQEFRIEPEDFAFYEKIQVPPPTWCPECRMIRRMVFYNWRKPFWRKEEIFGKETFSTIPPHAPLKIYDHDYWWQDTWDPMEYGKEYNFSIPFFDQFRDLLYQVPWPSRNGMNLVESDYCDNAADLRNCYLCFEMTVGENSGYVVRGETVKESFDLFDARHTELSYENYMSDEAYRVFFSVNCEECTEIWFSRNLLGCSYCFGCVNLRNKSYHIFNKPYTREEYLKFMDDFDSGSYRVLQEMRQKAHKFWMKFPMRFTLAIRVVNSTGEHIEKSRNLKWCYTVHDCENLAYCQFAYPPAYDSYDCTVFGLGFSLGYEVLDSGTGGYMKACYHCWPALRESEYSAWCRSSAYLFGCVSLQKKEYCILNKQYSKEDYFALREKIIQHMNSMPYTDAQRRVYNYGEFFPSEFSPFAYNETLAQDFFPLTKEEAHQKGYLWHEPEKVGYQTTIGAEDLTDHIEDVPDSILREVIKCISCGKAYRVIEMELEFLRRVSLPLPRQCADCRFRERFKFVNPPKFWHAKCQCAGKADGRGIYNNTDTHFHGNTSCPNEFETSYAPARPEIIYCVQCYQNEVL